MDYSKLSQDVLYSIANEYLDAAYKFSNKIIDDIDLIQYFKLINLSLKIFHHLSLNDIHNNNKDTKLFNKFLFNLNFLKIIINENLIINNNNNGNNFNLIETNLSDLINNINLSTDNNPFINNILFNSQFIKFFTLPLKRDNNYYSNLIIIDLNNFISYLQQILNENTTNNTNVIYKLSIFKFIEIFWFIKLKKNKKIIINKFNNLLSFNSKYNITNNDWNSIVILYYYNFLLNNNFLPSNHIDINLLNSIDNNLLIIWKLLLDLITTIKLNSNINNIIKKIQKILSNSNTISNNSSLLTIIFNDSITINLNLFTIFDFNILKNLLLFYQSINYLTISNSYNDNLNFLNKINNKKKIFNLITKNYSQSNKILRVKRPRFSIYYYDKRFYWLKSFKKLTDFYIIWQNLILNDNNNNIIDLISNYENENKNTIDSLLLSTISNQFNKNKLNYNINSILSNYNKIITNINTPIDIKIFSLLNYYLILSSQINLIKNNDKNLLSDKINKTNEIWLILINLIDNNYNFKNNNLSVTILIIWISTHFEPFTSNPMPCSDTEKDVNLNNFKKFYLNNSFLITTNDNNNIENSFKIKKSIFLQILINFLGCRLFEHDINKICKISNYCFQLSIKFNFNSIFTYINGLWHLINSTSAMKKNDVLDTKEKLKKILINYDNEIDHDNTDNNN